MRVRATGPSTMEPTRRSHDSTLASLSQGSSLSLRSEDRGSYRLTPNASNSWTQNQGKSSTLSTQDLLETSSSCTQETRSTTRYPETRPWLPRSIILRSPHPRSSTSRISHLRIWKETTSIIRLSTRNRKRPNLATLYTTTKKNTTTSKV